MRAVSALAALAALLGSPAAAGEGPTVVACDTLLAARRLDAAAPRADASEPGCRSIDRAAIGTVEQRAMIGGAPYECLTVAGRGGCLWLVP